MFLIVLGALAADPTTVLVDRDNVEITASCSVRLSEGPIPDADGNGVVHITASGVTVDFGGGTLNGALPAQLPDFFAGTGVRITAANVNIRNLLVRGYKVGIHATDADQLVVEGCDISHNFRQRLKSTPAAEDGSDWLWPHANDGHEWRNNYGAGLCVEDSDHVVLRRLRARHGQNGIILDRVNESKVYDCDCSFMSGWGLALWRSSSNVISRDAFDFCVRGYSHGVYNRGQDSAGILMFEQCCDNVIAENSATHGGDGFFGFAGKEALGEVNPRDDLAWYNRRGNNGNLIVGNDFSYAVAHGLELTFSFDNRITFNRFVGNAICGIWGGYSQGNQIGTNAFSENGDGAYGLERGGINIEHGRDNVILLNAFENNACGVHLWWDDDRQLLTSLWARANLADEGLSAIIRENTFRGDKLALHLRDLKQPVFLTGNAFWKAGEEMRVEGASTVADDPEPLRNIERSAPEPDDLLGVNQPRGGRQPLWGRQNIIMTEWGPWDHESPLLQFVDRFDHADEYRLRGAAAMPDVEEVRIEGRVFVEIEGDRLSVRPRALDTLIPYAIAFESGGHALGASGLLTGGTWVVKTFPSPADPREDAEGWHRGADHPADIRTIDPLDLRFGMGSLTEARGLPTKLPSDHFGTISTRTLTFPPGKWIIRTTSDDGIRVWMDGKIIIDDWTHHGPTRHDHEFLVEVERAIDLRVEHFELDGYAVLAVEIEPVR